MNYRSLRSLSCLVALLVLSGCASTVRVESDPPGALVRMRGSGRSSYRWRSVGITPCEFKANYSAIHAYVRWADGTDSEKVRVGLPRFGDPDPVRFSKP